jgi:hypothetical protein
MEANMTNLEELKRIAEAATPGNWGYSYDGSGDFSINTDAFEHTGDRCIASLWRSYTDSGKLYKDGDAAFIAAANPQTVLSLIDRIERLRSALDLAQDWMAANVPEMECRGGEDCDHCLATQIEADLRKALKKQSHE